MQPDVRPCAGNMRLALTEVHGREDYTSKPLDCLLLASRQCIKMASVSCGYDLSDPLNNVLETEFVSDSHVLCPLRNVRKES